MACPARWLLALTLALCAACRGPQPLASGPPATTRQARELGDPPDGGQLPTAFRRGRTVDGPAPPAGDGPCVVGVPECDEYLAKFYICVSQQISEPQRASMEQALRSTCESLRLMALSSAGRPGLPQACLTALSAARQSMAAFGCTW